MAHKPSFYRLCITKKLGFVYFQSLDIANTPEAALQCANILVVVKIGLRISNVVVGYSNKRRRFPHLGNADNIETLLEMGWSRANNSPTVGIAVLDHITD
jgi:hypothetical protein